MVRVALAAVIGLFMVACGDDDSSASTPSTGGGAGAGASAGAGGSAGSAGGGGSAGSAGASSGCGAKAPPNGKRTFTFDGAERFYFLHVPKGYDQNAKTPLVVNFHGRTPSSFGVASELHELVSKMEAKSDSAGFIVVRPQGVTDPDNYQTWNAGACCAADKTRDDVGFVDALLAELESALCIDPKRIYAAGLSNGGFMSHRLACERAERFAAVAPVAAANGMATCNPSRPMPVMAFNGTADNLVAHNLGQASMTAWAARNGCDSTPTQSFQNGDSTCETYPNCEDGAEIVFCSVQGGGHTWPGGGDLSAVGFGKTTMDLIANDAMWDFFVKHPLP